MGKGTLVACPTRFSATEQVAEATINTSRDDIFQMQEVTAFEERQAELRGMG